MRYIFFITMALGFLNQAFSHSPEEITFSIYDNKKNIVVDAEFPWSLRNAVFMFDTSLSNLSTLQEIQQSLFRYVDQNLAIKDRKGDKLKLLQVNALKGESHHEPYQLIFEKKRIRLIRNTLLFNFSGKQKNFHSFDVDGQKLEFVLTKESPEIIIETKNGFNYFIMFVVMGMGVLVFLLFEKRLLKT